MKKIKVLSLFDGISCAQQALKNLGIECDYYASEIDKYAIQITQKNFPFTMQMGDVSKISKLTFDSGCVDLLIGGSPCQDLSIAKKDRKGLDGSRSGLFYEYVRILNEVKPKYFILENVNSMPREAKETITKELFGIEPVMINAALVSAQNRKRLFWVGKLVENTYVKVDITQPEDKGILLRDILESDVDSKYCISSNQAHATITENKSTPLVSAMGMGGGHIPMIGSDKEKLKSNTIRTSGRGSGVDDKHNWDTIRIGQIGKGGQGDRIYSPDGKSVNLSANGGGHGVKTGLYAIIPEATKQGYAIAHEGQSIDLSFPNSKTRRGRVGDKVKNIMTSQNIGVLQDSIIRKLTPVECERLQSLPDNYTEGVSNSQRYKALGNGFNCKVVEHILGFLSL